MTRRRMAGEVPEGWRSVPVAEIAQIIMGQAPAGAHVLDWDGRFNHSGGDSGGLPFIQGNAEFGAKFPVPQKWCVQPRKMADAGDVLMSVRAPVGETNRADQRLAIGRGLAAIRFVKADPSFGWHAVNHSKHGLGRVAQGSTFKAIDSTELRNLALLLPPVPEQRAIATVLDAVDAAIEQTEAVIAATTTLRKSLLQDLLTRGVPGWHTEWKQVPGIGTIPADWEVKELGEVARVQTGRAVNQHTTPADGQKVPYITVANVKDGHLDLANVKTMLVRPREIARYALRPGDVLFTEGGDADKLGRGTIWRGEIDSCIHQNHIFVVRPRDGQLAPEFLSFYASSPAGKAFFLGAAKQTTNLASMNSSQLVAMSVPVPTTKEQAEMVRIVGTHSNLLRALRVEADRQSGLKALLSAALLSGRIRTKWDG